MNVTDVADYCRQNCWDLFTSSRGGGDDDDTHHHDDEHVDGDLKRRPTTAEKYGYGTLSVFIISICPIVSVVIVKFRRSSRYKYVIGAMLGLCVGSLVGDSLMHLIPHIISPHDHQHLPQPQRNHSDHAMNHSTDHNHDQHDHNHDHHDHDPAISLILSTSATSQHTLANDDTTSSSGHSSVYTLPVTVSSGSSVASHTAALPPSSAAAADDDKEDEHDKTITWKMMIACFSLWLFMDLQMVISLVSAWLAKRKKKSEMDLEKARQSHENKAYAINSDLDCDSLQASGPVTQIRHPPTGDDNDDDEGGSDGGHHGVDTLHVHADPSVAWMLTIGDGLHNFTDGLAIGASFAVSNSAGLSTSIAVFCHELPHEFGDAALMLSAGWTWRMVIVLQSVAQLTAFIGLYIGVSISNSFDEAQMWIFSIAAGMFLFIALSDAVPEILELVLHYKSFLIFLLANVGVAVGYLVMVLLAIFEEKIKI